MISKPFGSGRHREKLPYEVKIAFFIAIVLFYPVAMMCLLQSKPTIKYWFGDTWVCTVLIVVAWFLMCQFMLLADMMPRTFVPIYMISIPTAVMTIVCQVQTWHLEGSGSALEASDCLTFPVKAQLENSWQKAHDLLQECTQQLTNITGASISETRKLQGHSYYYDCPKYSKALHIYRKDWEYLEHVERAYLCGGWCSPSEPLWTISTNPRSKQGRLQDSCSKAVGRDMMGQMLLMGTQVTTYMAVCFFLSTIVLLVRPSWLAGWITERRRVT